MSDESHSKAALLEKQVEEIAQELQQKDALIASMKDKTRDFVNKLKSEHSAVIIENEAKFKSILKETSDSLSAVIAERDATIASLKTQITKISENPNEANIGALNDVTIELQSKLQDQESKTSEMSNKIHDLMRSLDIKEDELSSQHRENEVKSVEILKMRAEIKELEGRLTSTNTKTSKLIEDNQKYEDLSLQHAQRIIELESENKALISKCSDSSCLLVAVQNEIQRLEADLKLARSEDSVSAISFRIDLDSKNNIIEQMRSEIAKHDANIVELKSTLSLKDKELNDVGLRLEQSYSLAKMLEDQNVSYQKQLDEKEKNLKHQTALLQQHHFIKNNEYTNEILCLQESVSIKDMEIQKLITNAGQLQSQIEHLLETNNDFKRQLLFEQNQQKEAKNKVKVYVDSIILEKRSLEESVQQANNSKILLEQQLKHLEMKVCTLQDQVLSEQDKVTNAYAEVEKQFKTELSSKDAIISSLKDKLMAASTHSVEEVVELQKKIKETHIELESHKNKRIAARNEIIAAAKALESVEKENEELKHYFKSSLFPIISQMQVQIDSLVPIVSYASSTISKKKDIQRAISERNNNCDLSSHNASSHDKSDKNGCGQEGDIELTIDTGLSGADSFSNDNGSNCNIKHLSLRQSINEAKRLKLGLDRGILSARSLAFAIESLKDLILVDSEISNRSCIASIIDTCFYSFRKKSSILVASPHINNARNGYSVINEDSDSVALSVVNSPIANNQYSNA